MTPASLYNQGTNRQQATETGGADDVINITPNSNQRNPPPFEVQEYVAQHGEYLDAERFAAIAVGPEGVSAHVDETGWRRCSRRGYGKIDGRMRQHNGASKS